MPVAATLQLVEAECGQDGWFPPALTLNSFFIY